jgi:nucleoside phosphorylase
MFVVINRMPGGIFRPQSLIDFGRREAYDGDICFRGQIGETTVLFVSATDGPADFEAVAERILSRNPIRLAVYVGPATPLVPYLQQGDLIVADRILAWPDGDNSSPNEIILAEGEPNCVVSEPELVGGMIAVYEMLYAGRSNRPQMIIGSVVSGDYQTIEQHAAADMHQRYGVIAGDKNCLAMARIAQAQDIRFLYLGMTSDTIAVGDENDGFPTPAAVEPMMAVLQRFIQSRPVATVAPVPAGLT